MTRIIAGTAGGRRLAVPRGRTTRPTSDRVREALFASVLSELGTLTGLRVLDLYAGSGAIGLEALSRGAAQALLVEADRRAAAVIDRNITQLGLPGARLVVDRVERVLSRSSDSGPYDFVFADPPYATGEHEVVAMLEALRDHGWLADSSLIVVERSTRQEAMRWPDGYQKGKVRQYGETTLWYGHAASLPNRY